MHHAGITRRESLQQVAAYQMRPLPFRSADTQIDAGFPEVDRLQLCVGVRDVQQTCVAFERQLVHLSCAGGGEGGATAQARRNRGFGEYLEKLTSVHRLLRERRSRAPFLCLTPCLGQRGFRKQQRLRDVLGSGGFITLLKQRSRLLQRQPIGAPGEARVTRLSVQLLRAGEVIGNVSGRTGAADGNQGSQTPGAGPIYDLLVHSTPTHCS